MTKKEKTLLTKVLCEQLPYGVFVKENRFSLDDGLVIYTPDYHPCIYDCKPYLRPMDSMTEEERNEIESVSEYNFGKALDADIKTKLNKDYDSPESRILEYCACSSVVDWLNAHHFDYRGLIKKGLAIAAAGESSPYKEKGGEE